MGVYDTFLQSKQNKPTGTSVYQQFQASKVAPVKSGGFVSAIANAVTKPITFMAGSIQSAFQNKEKTDFNLLRGTTKAAYKTWADTVVDTSKRFEQASAAWAKPGKNDKLDVAVKTGQAGLGILNTFFAPITGVMKGLETNPVIGWAAASVNGIFAGIGEGSADVAVNLLNRSNLSQETKAKIEPLVAETAALVGMLAAGKAGGSAYTKIRSNTKTILNEVKDEAGLKSSARFTEPKPPTGVEIKNGVATAKSEGNLYSKFQSETGLKLQQEAQAKGIVFNADVPVQQRMNMLENLKSAEEIVKADPVKAERFLTREEPLPQGVEIGSIYKALKQRALIEGDAGLVERLSRTTAGTESARALKSFDEGIKLTADPVEAVTEVRQARLEAAVGREKGMTIEKAIKETKAKVPKIEKPSKQTWVDFIKSLEC